MTAQIVHRCELRFAVKKGIVEEAGEEAAEERADPIDALISPVICGESGAEGAGDLRSPIGNGFDRGDAFGDPEADGDGGIEMATGDVPKSRDHKGDGKAVGDGDGEKSGTEWFMEKAEGADSASAEENERKGTDELGGKLLGRGVHGGASRAGE